MPGRWADPDWGIKIARIQATPRRCLFGRIAPATFPVLVNGGFLKNQATKLADRVHAKSLVLDDGSTRVAIVVVDSCMMPRELLDRAKELARDKTGIPAERILISATHTHSAPAAMGALGCPADAEYAARLPGWIAESIERATKLLEPARVGWNVIDDHKHTFCRRWIRRPEKTARRPVRPADGTRQHASRLRKPRSNRTRRPGRPRSDGTFGPIAYRAAHCRLCQLFDALFWSRAYLG